MDLLCWTFILFCVFVLTSGENVENRRQLCTDDKSQCFLPGSTEVCSGRGECVCGNCQCKSRRGDLPLIYTGRWCECDDSRCPSYNDAVCGGSDHGVCDCGFCKCYKHFTGRNCGCPTRTDKCKAKDGSICGNHGDCKCNKCQCDKGYGGQNCTECQGCDTCEANRECVECIIWGSKHSKTNDNCKQTCTKLNIMVVDEVEENDNLHKTEKLCKYNDIMFLLRKDEKNGINIKASRLMVSDEPSNSSQMMTSSLALAYILVITTVLCLYHQ